MLRIKFNETEQTSVNVDISFLDNIWIPDFYFYDLNHFKELKSFRIQGGLSIVKNEPNTGNENLFGCDSSPGSPNVSVSVCPSHLLQLYKSFKL